MPAYANGQRYVSKGGRASASGSPIPTQAGDTARPSRRARAAASTATRSTPPSAPARTSRSRGRSRRRARTNRPLPPGCSTRRRIAALPPRRPRSTWDTTPKRSTRAVRRGTPARSSRSEADSRREARRPSPARVRARDLDLCRSRSGAWRVQVALPDRRVQACEPVDQGRPPASARPARVEALEVALPRPWRSRTRVRTLEARVGATAAPRARD